LAKKNRAAGWPGFLLSEALLAAGNSGPANTAIVDQQLVWNVPEHY
jgi:hypothetical protein